MTDLRSLLTRMLEDEVDPEVHPVAVEAVLYERYPDARRLLPPPPRPTPAEQIACALTGSMPSAQELRALDRERWLLRRARSQAARLGLIERSTARYRSPLLVARLLGEARLAVHDSPAEAFELAELAAAVAAAGVAGAGSLALALAYQANARRADGRLTQAAPLFESASRMLRLQGGGPWVHGEIASLRGSWLKDSRRFDEAHRCLDDAVEQFDRARDPVAIARSLLIVADCHWLTGDAGRAVHVASEALELIHATGDARLFLFANHNVCRYLVALDQPERADALFRVLTPNYEALDDRQTTVRRSWLEGVIAHRLGHSDRAERLLHSAVDEYVAMKAPYDAALAALDLALVLLDQARTTEVTPLAASLPPLFEAEGIHREATAAVVLFHRAAARRRLDAALLDRLRDFLERSRVDRDARLNG